LFADSGESEEKKEQARKKDDTERGLPGNAAAKDNRVSEVGVEGHARSKRDRIVGPQPHDERGDRSGNASGKENALDRHAGFRKDARVDYDHVGHGHESGQSPEQLTANSSVIFFEMKYALEQACFLQVKRCVTIGRERRNVNDRSVMLGRERDSISEAASPGEDFYEELETEHFANA